jgi:Zn2+/Cd2+-exporting ATPase
MGNCCNTHSGCGCNHKHDHNHGHSHEHSHCHAHDGLKGKVVLIGATILLLVGAALIEHSMNLTTWQLLLIYLVPYLLIGHDTLKEAAENIGGTKANATAKNTTIGVYT